MLRRFAVRESDAGRRLDIYLASQIPGLSRTRIQELIEEGRVRVCGKRTKAAHRVEIGETIEIEAVPRPSLQARPEPIPIELLYEDEDVVVVNKPAGMVIHAGAGARSGTMVNALLYRLGSLSKGEGVRPGIVHRLDRGTSGAVVVARTDVAHRVLAAQFRARSVGKTYLALVHGNLARDAGVIELPITRDPHRRTRMTARLGRGREARTSWRVLLRLGNFTLVAAELHTGRTHQIRAHFAAIGHPLAGDTLYGAALRPRAGNQSMEPLGRVFLHAARIAFDSPRDGRRVEVRAPLDPGLRGYLERLARAAGTPRGEVDAALNGYL